MEEAGIDWKCPTCKEQVEEKAVQPESEEMETDQLEPTSTTTTTDPTEEDDHTDAAVPQSASRRARTVSRRRKSSETQEKPKPKAPRCHMCTKPPRQSSIYCSGKFTNGSNS